MSKIAVVLVRGTMNARKEIIDTLKMLNLNKKNSCVILDNNQVNKGMIKKVKDFVTYGEVNEEVVKKLQGRLNRKSYKLNPPRKGYGKKGIKKPFNIGGALGYRGKSINNLLERML